ncbi:uncharacterized protein HHUB_2394 [Halobacterium hubeiense]|uniref:Uncharacterized protein n=1 Tax=Halobacterium hubeiense TaxID=1407499 RepID=A0A0U5H0E1_9EURY|nr:uncharacterized protein HHUB_2394 [Halobacterium hubeiense]
MSTASVVKVRRQTATVTERGLNGKLPVFFVFSVFDRTGNHTVSRDASSRFGVRL